MLTPPVLTTCALCLNGEGLRESHIIPAFAVRWLKETSATGHIRHGTSPDKRQQDGVKYPLLCSDCEGLFSRDERSFANEIFYPFDLDPMGSYAYGPWFTRFCVSVSWRMLMTFRDRAFSDAVPELEAAEKRWRTFLLGDVADPGPYRQFILPLYPVGQAPQGTPEGINRYLLRSLDGELVANADTAMTYTKVGRLAVFGLISGPPSKWKGMAVGLKEGVIRPADTPPDWLLRFLFDRAREYDEVRRGISPRQQDKVIEAMDRNLPRTVGSHSVEAIMYDADLFGLDAVCRKRST